MAENEKLIEQRCCELLKARGMTLDRKIVV